jgi:hypothetical protein
LWRNLDTQRKKVWNLLERKKEFFWKLELMQLQFFYKQFPNMSFHFIHNRRGYWQCQQRPPVKITFKGVFVILPELLKLHIFRILHEHFLKWWKKTRRLKSNLKHTVWSNFQKIKTVHFKRLQMLRQASNRLFNTFELTWHHKTRHSPNNSTLNGLYCCFGTKIKALFLFFDKKVLSPALRTRIHAELKEQPSPSVLEQKGKKRREVKNARL